MKNVSFMEKTKQTFWPTQQLQEQRHWVERGLTRVEVNTDIHLLLRCIYNEVRERTTLNCACSPQ